MRAVQTHSDSRYLVLPFRYRQYIDQELRWNLAARIIPAIRFVRIKSCAAVVELGEVPGLDLLPGPAFWSCGVLGPCQRPQRRKQRE